MALVALGACAGGRDASKPAPASPAAAVAATIPRALPTCPEPAHEAVVGPRQPLATDAGTGAIRGVVRDKATQGGLRDVTVVATSPALEGQASELTDSAGSYQLANLPPGTYEVDAYFGELHARQAQVAVGSGTVVPVTIQLDTAVSAGDIVPAGQPAPTVDGDFGPGPRDPNDARGGRLWPEMRTIGQDYSRGAHRAPCRPSPR